MIQRGFQNKGAQTFCPFDGGLLIDKPVGPTSHDVVARIRRQFGIKKVGHCGSLDPNATGLMLILLGKGTKLSEKLMNHDKVYSGKMKLGVNTSTYDAVGEITSSSEVPELGLETLNNLASEFLGDQMQLPPMVSAVKQNGVRLYKLARKGVEVERKERFIHIYSYTFSEYSNHLATFRVACTKGTYIRTLAYDLGVKLGCGAHLHELRREGIGDHRLKEALNYDHLKDLTSKDLEAKVIPFLKLAE